MLDDPVDEDEDYGGWHDGIEMQEWMPLGEDDPDDWREYGEG